MPPKRPYPKRERSMVDTFIGFDAGVWDLEGISSLLRY